MRAQDRVLQRETHAGEGEAAVGMLGDLSELLRRSLTHGGLVAAGNSQLADASVSRREELEFSERYLQTERVRFGPEKLCVRRHIAPETLEARVPGFLLQPLLENAVKHGVNQRVVDGGEIELRAWRDGAQLHLEVRDNRLGLGHALRAELGTGTRLLGSRTLFAEGRSCSLTGYPAQTCA